MSANIDRSSVQSHTEYTLARVRCPRCGTTVPKDAVDGGVCLKCSEIG